MGTCNFPVMHPLGLFTSAIGLGIRAVEGMNFTACMYLNAYIHGISSRKGARRPKPPHFKSSPLDLILIIKFFVG